jgi:hypothetical protein
VGKVVLNLRLLGPDFPETETEMRSQDEKCTQGKTKDHKLVFLTQLILRGVSPQILDLPYLWLYWCSHSSLSQGLSESDPPNLLNFVPNFANFGDGFKWGWNMNQRVKLGPKSRVTLKIALISASNLHFHLLHVFCCFRGVKFLQISHPCMIWHTILVWTETNLRVRAGDPVALCRLLF